MILGDFWAYDHSETFTSLSYFCKMNVLKKNLGAISILKIDLFEAVILMIMKVIQMPWK